jgi:thiamine transport system substrate-binding protein
MPAEEIMKVQAKLVSVFIAVMLLPLLVVACSNSDDNNNVAKRDCLTAEDSVTITTTSEDSKAVSGESIDLVVYDAFLAPPGAFEKFTEETGIVVNILTTADTGTMVSQAVLTSGDPIGDVMFGVDNTFLCRALLNNVFSPYRPSTWDQLEESLKLDPFARVTPVDFGDICLNYWIDDTRNQPTSIKDLTDTEYAGSFVTQNPETSAPGMGFLLASIAVFGEDGWEQYWKDLRNNDIEIRSGWTEAYYEDFYSKERNIVTSYATSPIAEYIFSDPPLSKPPTGVVGDSCFRSIEFVGILRGTDSPVASAMLIEFLTSTYFQELIPETNFVLPANKKAELPETFKKFLKTDLEPVMIAPELIELKRNEWTESWTQIVIR